MAQHSAERSQQRAEQQHSTETNWIFQDSEQLLMKECQLEGSYLKPAMRLEARKVSACRNRVCSRFVVLGVRTASPIKLTFTSRIRATPDRFPHTFFFVMSAES